MQRDTSVRAIVDAGFHSAGLMPQATCEAIYMMTAVGMVRGGLGLTVLSGLRARNKSRARPPIETDRRPGVYEARFHHQEIGSKPSAAEPNLS